MKDVVAMRYFVSKEGEGSVAGCSAMLEVRVLNDGLPLKALFTPSTF